MFGVFGACCSVCFSRGRRLGFSGPRRRRQGRSLCRASWHLQARGSGMAIKRRALQATWNSRRLIVFSKTDADEEADWPALGLPYVYVFRTSGVNADRSVGVVEIISDDVTAEEGREFLLGTGGADRACLICSGHPNFRSSDLRSFPGRLPHMSICSPQVPLTIFVHRHFLRSGSSL